MITLMRKRTLVALLMTIAAVASTGPVPHAQDAVTASVVVRLAAGKSTYFIGEAVPLDLEFRGTASADYFFSTGTCGELGTSREQVVVTPAAGIEDAAAGLRFLLGGSVVSCLSGWHPLNGTPLVIHAWLNDAVRFVRAGTYRVVISSMRPERYSRQPVPPMLSTPVDLTIVPTDESWAASETERARSLIDRAGSEQIHEGARILRYLGTEAAAAALVDRYDATANVDLEAVIAGLVLSPHRAAAMARMEARLDLGVDLHRTFISTLARLRVLQEIPPTPTNAAGRTERTKIIESQYEMRWRDAVAMHPANAATLGAELQRLQSNPSPAIAEDLERQAPEAAAAFVALTPAAQQRLLENDRTWQDLNRPWIVPALREAYAHWRGTANQNSFPGAGDLILKRLYERDPAAGRLLILEEIRTGAHQIRYDALAALPDPQLPEFDSALQSRYDLPPTPDRLNDRGTTAWLIARYGSAGLQPFVVRLLAEPVPGCLVEAGLIAYLFKHDAPAAMARLDPARARTLTDGCVTPPLAQLAARYWDDNVESAALAQLMTLDSASSAASVLGTYGSAAAKQPLLNRLTMWSSEWRNRAADLVRPGPPTSTSPAMIENSITNALFDNPRFKPTKEDADRIRALCVTDSCRTNVELRLRLVRTSSCSRGRQVAASSTCTP
ncbi:MAG: hypothetical protein ABI051_09875 [Vicinamibacterales bacterium]